MNQLIITGGSGGLGQAVVQIFSKLGWTVSAPSHNELDVSNFKMSREYLKLKQVDLLICAAGINRDILLTHLEKKTWDQVLAVNYQGAANAALAVLPKMIKQKKGHIIFISSYSAFHPPLGQVAYAASKAALLGLNQKLAHENGCYGIRVNTILPGFLETQMTSLVSKKRRSQILENHVLNCFNTPLAVAKFIAHLEHELPHTSGQVFQLDSRIS